MSDRRRTALMSTISILSAGVVWRFMMTRSGLVVMVLLSLVIPLSLARAESRKPVKPAERDKCPVCGMFVAKYPDFVAQIIFRDGSYAVFDGVKDMFKYYFNLKKYNQSKELSDIDTVYVTDYYDLTMTDGHSAFYVLGSDVYGPMGKELIPFQTEKAANEFMSDHVGQSLLKFQDISADTLKGLD
jgi:copper chaperone NosL